MTIKQALNKLYKSANLIIQKVEDNYYICNGYLLLVVPKFRYESVFSTQDAHYPKLEKNETIKWVNGDRQFSTNNIKSIWDTMQSETAYTVTAIESPFMTDWSTTNGTILRLFITESNNLIYVNQEYLDIIKALLLNVQISFMANEQYKSSSTLVCNGLGVMVCPVRANVPYTVDFKPKSEFKTA